MKINRLTTRSLCLLALLLTIHYPLTGARAQGTAFTYQGRLNDANGPATGLYDLAFRLFATNVTGVDVAPPVTNSATAVRNGLFTTTIDFGSGPFTGGSNWLELAVSTNGATSFSTLTPRQQITPTPYAIFANTASNVAGKVPAAQLTGTLPLAQLPATVVTNNQAVVTFTNVTVGNNLYLPTTTGSAGIIYSGGSLLLHAYGSQNFFAGVNAGNLTLGGYDNTGVGGQALKSLTSGLYNTALGYLALGGNQGGDYNTASGYQALTVNTSGSGNTANGYSALTFNNDGGNNTAIGYSALNSNIGSFNTASGSGALSSNYGSYNTANGANALSGWAGSYNTANGGYALYYNGGSFNTANGYQAIYGLDGGGRGNYNTANGFQALYTSGSGGSNTAVGIQSLYHTTVGANNTASGAASLFSNTTGSNNIALGYAAGYNLTTGSSNIDIGNPGLSTDTNIIRLGSSQTQAFITGVITGNGGGLTNLNATNFSGTISQAQLPAAVVTNNEPLVTLGALFLQNALILPATARISAGGSTMLYSDVKNNASFGVFANSGGTNNTAIGVQALLSNSGNNNVALGYNALEFNTTGHNNTASGYNALNANVDGNDNVAQGVGALQNVASGFYSTAVGGFALQNLQSGNNNLALGYNAGNNLANGANNIYVGSLGASTENGIIRLGTPGTHTQAYISGGVNLDPTGLNDGHVTANALTFGASSGEGIASQRTGGSTASGQYGLTFYTDYVNQMTILQNGNVGIGTNGPVAALEVASSGGFGSPQLMLDQQANDYARLRFAPFSYSPWDIAVKNTMNFYVNGATVMALATNGNLSVASITITGGSDLAEPFSISTMDQPVSEGEVVVIDEANPGQLKLTDQPYDTRVAGVISGANGIHPGIQMHQQGLLEGGKNVALTGRVYVQADTSNGSIKPGDLLTTSSTPGLAMKVSDHVRAQGAILGKAMTALLSGNGMVLVLVTLQ